MRAVLALLEYNVLVKEKQNESPISMVHGEEAKAMLDERMLQALTEHVVRHTTGIESVVRSKVGRALSSLLSVFPTSVRGRLEEYFTSSSSSQLKSMQAEVDYVRSIRDDNRLTVAMVGGEVAGMLGYKLAGSMPSDENSPGQERRSVYELCRASVLPKHEGRGVYKKLKSDVFDLVRRQFPDSPILSNTKDPVVKKKNLDLGYKEIPLELLFRIQGVSEREIPELAEKVRAWDKDSEWQTFLFDPLQK